MIISESDRFYKIRLEAIKLLKNHSIDTSVEIDIIELIKLSGLSIKWKIQDLKGITGFTCINTKKPSYCMFFDEQIFSNFPARLNFTMAHELGHIILDHFQGTETSLIFNYSKEREANIFVDELLMPSENVIRKQMSVKEIADTYNVSIAAAGNKIKYLKANSIYIREAATNYTYSFLNPKPYISDLDTYNSRMVKALHEHWLDPDYSIV